MKVVSLQYTLLNISRVLCALLLSGLVMVNMNGCRETGASPSIADSPSPRLPEVLADVDRVLDEIISFQLYAEKNTAWELMHGVLAFGYNCILVGEDGQQVVAIDYLLEGGVVQGWQWTIGLPYDSNRRGAIASFSNDDSSGQGHFDQWIAILGQSGVPYSAPIIVSGERLEIRDIIAQVQYDTGRSPELEFTLAALASYLSTDSEWTSFDGISWSMEELVEQVCRPTWGTGACHGSHRMIALATALKARCDEGARIDGAWITAEDQLAEAVRRAREFQYKDGRFSSDLFVRSWDELEADDVVRSNGHVIEFLAVHLDESELSEEWVLLAVSKLCESIILQLPEDPNLGDLYHAARGLSMYRRRMEQSPISGR